MTERGENERRQDGLTELRGEYPTPDAYWQCMQPTQIFLTDEQQRAISRRADDARISRSEVIRRILNDGLGIDDASADRLAAIDATAGIMPDAPDWQEWLAAGRGRENAEHGRSAQHRSSPQP